MKKIVIFLLCAMLILSGCGADSINTAEVIEVNTAQDSPTYVEGEDFQQNWNDWGNVASWGFTQNGSGYYFFDSCNTKLLRFYDAAVDTDVALCNQPNCQHDNCDCSAYFDYDLDYIQYYCGNLYSILNDGDDLSDASVYRISADGATQGKVGTVFSKTGSEAFRAVVHRGYVYCAMIANDTEQRTAELYRISLSGGEEGELVYTFDPCICGSTYLKAYGNYVYIALQFYEDTDGNGYDGTLYRCNIHTGEMEQVLEHVRRDFVVDSRYVYYDNDTQVIAYDLETGEETILLDVGYPVYLMMDEDYIYCDNTCGQWITYYATGQIPDGERTIIDKNTFDIVAAVVWEKEFGARLIGAVNGCLLGESGSQYYRYDLSFALLGEESTWVP